MSLSTLPIVYNNNRLSKYDKYEISGYVNSALANSRRNRTRPAPGKFILDLMLCQIITFAFCSGAPITEHSFFSQYKLILYSICTLVLESSWSNEM